MALLASQEAGLFLMLVRLQNPVPPARQTRRSGMSLTSLLTCFKEPRPVDFNSEPCALKSKPRLEKGPSPPTILYVYLHVCVFI